MHDVGISVHRFLKTYQSSLQFLSSGLAQLISYSQLIVNAVSYHENAIQPVNILGIKQTALNNNPLSRSLNYLLRTCFSQEK